MSIHPTSPSSSLFPPSFVPLLVELPPDSASGSSAPPPQIFTLFHQPPLPSERTLVFLHGYPQNGTLWWDVVRVLEGEGVLEGWNVVIPDLPGYGRSTKTPSPDGSHLAHSKLSIAANLISLLDLLLGPTSQFLLVGHDRGARVGYKLTKDFPNRVKGLCVQDIVPTRTMFERMKLEEGGHEETFKSYHWIFLALPSPLPETLINANPSFYFRHTIQSWTGKNGGHILSGEAMDSWVGQYNDPEVVQGALEDYRAGASLDLLHDELDSLDPSGGKVQTELLVLYSVHLSKRFDVEKVWNALRGEGKGIKVVKIGDEGTGHFLPVEAAKEVTKKLMEFMKRCE